MRQSGISPGPTSKTDRMAWKQYSDIFAVKRSVFARSRACLIVSFILILSVIGIFTGEVAASNAAVGLSEASENALSIPRWLYVATGGAAIGASALLAGFITDRRLLNRIHTWNSTFSVWRPVYDWGRRFGAVIGVSLAAIIIIRGLTGPQIPTVNVAIIIIFAGFRAGITITSYVFGNVWMILNPAHSIATVIPTTVSSVSYPSQFDRWPALFGLFILIWIETTTAITTRPTLLALVIGGYLIVSIIGAIIFREAWFRNIDPVSVFFRFYSQAAPFNWSNGQVQISIPAMTLIGNSRIDPTATKNAQSLSSNATTDGGENQLGSIETTAHPQSQSQSRDNDAVPSLSESSTDQISPLIEDRSDIAVAVMLVWELTFSGFVTTTQGGAVIRAIVASGIPSVITYLCLFIGGFILFYAAFLFAGRIAADRLLTTWSATDLTVAFAPSLIAIAVGYHLAHYVGFLLSLSPSLFGAVISPFSPPSNPAILTLPAWISAINIVFILAGHLVAIWVAHSTAYQLFPSRLQAIRSQYPFIFVMMGYTIVSLWLVSLPTATPPFIG